MAGKKVRLPAAAERVWGWFWLLDRTRNGNGYGPYRLTFQDLGWWKSVTGARPDEWELAAILAMDAIRLNEIETPAKQPDLPKLTPALARAALGG